MSKFRIIPATLFFIMPSLWAAASFWGFEDARVPHLGVIYAHPMQEFTEGEYVEAVDWIFESVERDSGRSLERGELGRVALRVNSNSGDGMQTPLPLVRAVIAALVRRGYAREDLMIIDTKALRLRDAGFLPPLSQPEKGRYFDGVPVYALDDGEMWDEVWYYENPLPVQFTPEMGAAILAGEADPREQRKSFLPKPLLTDVDYWINLPVVTDHPAMEINGALANASLWGVSNRQRFFNSPANAPVAMAEIAAVPELLSNLAFTIMSLERYQIIAGPWFNSFYCRSEPVVLASVDPAILDSYAGSLINKQRESKDFRPMSAPPQAAAFARLLGVGLTDVEGIRWERPSE